MKIQFKMYCLMFFITFMIILFLIFYFNQIFLQIDATICQRSNFQQIGQILSVGGGKIIKFFFIKEYYHLVFFTTNIRFSQIASYDLNTFQTVMYYTCAQQQNDCTVLVDALYDRDQNFILLIDKFGNFQAINYSGLYLAKIILKIPDFMQPKFNNLKGLSLDLRTNTLLIYNSLSVYYIPYGDLNDYMKQIKYSNQYLFADISFNNQDLQNNTYIILGQSGILYKYQQAQQNFFYNFDEEAIQIQYNQQQQILLIAFLDKITVFKNINQTSIQQISQKLIQKQEILLGTSQFTRFLSEGIFLTQDSVIWHYDFSTQMILYKFSFGQFSLRISSELFSVTKNLLLLGLSSGDLVIYNLIEKQEKIFKLSQFDQQQTASVSISFIKETQSEFFICFSSALGVFQISKTTYNIRQMLKFQDIQKYQIIQDSTIQMFEVDEKFSRIYLNFVSETILRRYQYDQNPLSFKYIMLTKRQQNKIQLGNNILILYSSAFMLIYDRQTLQYLSSIRRLNNQYFITEVKLILDQYLLIISQQRVEFFILTNIQSPKLVDQVNVTNPIIVNFQVQSSKSQLKYYFNPNILFAIILGENQIIEKRYSLDYEESDGEQKYCFASFQVQSYYQFFKELSQVKPQTYPSSTQIDILANPNSSSYNYLMVKFSNQNMFPLDNSNTKNSSVVFYSSQISTPIENNQSINQLNVNNFTLFYNKKQDVYLRDFQIVFQNNTFMNHSEQMKNISFENLYFENQELTNIICSYFNLTSVVFKRYTFFNSYMGISEGENSGSFLNFQNIEQIYIYDFVIDNNFSNKIQFRSLLTANNVTILVIKNLTIKNAYMEEFINIYNVQQLFIENINIINCQYKQSSNYSLNLQSIFLITGVQTTTFENISMLNCKDLSLIYSLNSQLLKYQQVNFESDTIIFKNFKISSNIFSNSKISPLIFIRNSYITFTNINYISNQGNIQVSICSEFEISQSFLSNNQNQDGGALSIQNCLNKISISTTTFISNRAFASGGAIFISEFYGNFSIQVSSTIIRDNNALIGGGLRIINQNNDKFGFNFWNQIKFVFINNTAEIYGNNFTTFLQDIQVSLPQNHSELGEEQGNNTLKDFRTKDQLKNIENELWYGVAVIDNFRSGSYFILQLSLIDLEKREFTYSPQKLTQDLYPLSISQEITSIKFKLEKVSQSSFISITGQDIITHQQFIGQNNKYIFKQVQVTSLPSSQQYIQISYTLNLYQKVKNKPILVKLNLRKCQRGEIVKQISNNIFSCFQCPVGFYSIADPVQPSYQQNATDSTNTSSQQCNNCPFEAFFCQRDIIELKNGYWRESEQSTEIIQCNSIFNACQGQDSNSKNYCGYGYTGPVCRECDYLGNTWYGKKFSKSLQNELKCSECLFLYLQITITILFFLSFMIYLQLQMILFMNSFMQHQICYYLRIMKIIPILNNSIKDQSSFYLKILINFTQISSILVSYQNSIFPDVFSVIPSFFGSPTSSIMISISCLVSQLSKSEIERIQTLQILQSILPFLYLIFCLFVTNVLQSMKQFDIKQYHKFTLINLIFVIFQPNQVSFFSNQLVCTKVGSKYYVSSDMHIDCSDPAYRKFAYTISIPFLLFWSFLPLLIFFKLRKRSKTLDYCKTRYIFGYYYTEFKNEFYYWDIIRIYIRVLIVVLSTLLKEYSFINQQICVFILYIYIKKAIFYSPIVNKNLQKFDNFCYQVIIFNTILSTINSSLQSQILLVIIWTIHFLFIMKIIFQIIIFKFNNPQNFFRKNLVSLLQKLHFTSLSQNLQSRQNKEKKSLLYWKHIFKNIQVLIKKQAFEQINQNSTFNYLSQTQNQTVFLQSIRNFQANFIEQKASLIINLQNQSIFSSQNENPIKPNYEFQQTETRNENTNFHDKQAQSNEIYSSVSSKSNTGEQKETKILLEKENLDKSSEYINGLQDLDLNSIPQNAIFQQNYETQFKLFSQRQNLNSPVEKN
ncbi:transmembrane protein, putative (macronuclear) [Tetrahymena thermophila SB210]|uniref:Transmembrane protein, putative n=1 Tax=Tetrahymena thermophila (strain SB210) TaxID=312017 RepID=W7XDM1_TETTS|nr:transmembrane protein, putative [Tetrahymena thermophila SB210]EWS75677.1 transmembrane protein, putative [Tetrahymena thermophila SB210]|eukprot:XP_012651823.1 transmembrane protein, putative [Tetrahymena thermophila SB210]